GLKVLQCSGQGGERLSRGWIRIVPVEVRLNVISASGNHSFIRMVENIPSMERTDPAAGRGKVRCSEPQVLIDIADPVASADFAEPAYGVAQVNTTQYFIDAVIRTRIGIGENQERELARLKKRVDEPLAQGPPGPVKVRSD